MHIQSVHTARTRLQVSAARTGVGGRLAGSDGGGMGAACVLVLLLVAAAEATKDRHEGIRLWDALRAAGRRTENWLRKSAEEFPGIDPAADPPTHTHTAETSHTRHMVFNACKVSAEMREVNLRGPTDLTDTRLCFSCQPRWSRAVCATTQQTHTPPCLPALSPFFEALAARRGAHPTRPSSLPLPLTRPSLAFRCPCLMRRILT